MAETCLDFMEYQDIVGDGWRWERTRIPYKDCSIGQAIQQAIVALHEQPMVAVMNPEDDEADGEWLLFIRNAVGPSCFIKSDTRLPRGEVLLGVAAVGELKKFRRSLCPVTKTN